ncbi:MAG: carbohydrate ABC transporter permease [Planctomycetes bacterium]|nr:carbohydrate ABC transporter permease [Planctomycetota bacterium]
MPGGAGRRAGSALILLAALAYLTPLIWMIALSVKPAAQAGSATIALLPRLPEEAPVSKASPGYWAALAAQASANYREVWSGAAADFPTYFRNSLIVGILSVLGMTVSSAVAAYGFSRVRWPGRDAVFVLVLLTLMIPQAVLMSPQFLLFKQLGMIGSLLPLWLPSWFGGAFSIFLLRQFFLSIPNELDEAARIDGCSHLGTFLRVVLPLSKPALAAVALLQAVATWNDFLGPLLFLNREEQYTLSLGLQMYQSQHGGTPWNLVMAASCIVVLPVLGLYVLTRRFFVEGVAGQGLKE